MRELYSLINVSSSYSPLTVFGSTTADWDGIKGHIVVDFLAFMLSKIHWLTDICRVKIKDYWLAFEHVSFTIY